MKFFTKSLLIAGVAASLMGCFGTEEEGTAPVDYSTTEFTLERLLDGGGQYVLDANAEAYFTTNAITFENGQGITSEFGPGDVSTLSFSMNSSGVTEMLFEVSEGGSVTHSIVSDVTIGANGTLDLTIWNPFPDNGKSLRPEESNSVSLTGKIVQDITGQVYIQFDNSVLHYPADPNVVGNEFFLRK